MRVHMDKVATYLLDPFAPAHEFGHILGFYHAANGNGDIISYDSTPTVKLRRLQQLYDRNKSFVSKYFGW